MSFFLFNIIIKGNFLGNKLYELRVEKPRRRGTNANVIFRDSFNLFPMALSALPSAFGLAVEDKPWFPLLANCPENYGVVLPKLPPPSQYFCNSMMPAKRKAFDDWYAANRDQTFELDEELAAYCLNDVTILLSALIAFRAEFLEISSHRTSYGPNNTRRPHDGVDPLR